MAEKKREYMTSSQKSVERMQESERAESPDDESTSQTIEEQMKHLDEEKQRLKAELVKVKESKKVERSNFRDERDEKLAAVRVKLDMILDAIYEYNKFGKAEKTDSGILDKIVKLTSE